MSFMWTLEGDRDKIMDSISQHTGEKEVRIKTKPSKKIFLHLLQATKVERIYISEGLVKTISNKVKEALHSSGAKLIELKKRAGRPEKFGMELKEKALWMLNEGKSAKEISKLLNVPATSIYFWKKKAGKGEKIAENENSKFVDST